MIEMESIGVLHSCFKAKFGTPRQSQIVKNSTGYIEIHKKWEPLKCLKGLDSFSHAWVLFWFHENKNLSYRPIVRPPRLGRKGVGALATRSPLRPNPIGLSLVKIDRVVGDRIYISGVDIIEGTPVFDIKPYIHEYDSVQNSSCGWLEDVTSTHIEVEFLERAIEDISSIAYPNLQKNIEDILKTDIRNRNDKSLKNEGKALGFYFEDLNVVFECYKNKVVVLKIEKIKT
jgi:tRNA-Thr(GGU) m(6)t(6)A37 methyltransferase TsaA